MIGRRGNQFRLGDIVLVKIVNVDMDDRKLELGVVEKISGGEVPKSKQDKKKKDKKPKKGKGKKDKHKKKKRKKDKKRE